MAKSSWFTHEPMTTEEANQLLDRYKNNGVQATKSLSADNRHWFVQAFLPESNYLPNSKIQTSKIWR